MTDIRGVELVPGQRVVVVTHRYGRFDTYEASIVKIGRDKVTLDNRRWNNGPLSSVLPNHIAVL